MCRPCWHWWLAAENSRTDRKSEKLEYLGELADVLFHAGSSNELIATVHRLPAITPRQPGVDGPPFSRCPYCSMIQARSVSASGPALPEVRYLSSPLFALNLVERLGLVDQPLIGARGSETSWNSPRWREWHIRSSRQRFFRDLYVFQQSNSSGNRLHLESEQNLGRKC